MIERLVCYYSKYGKDPMYSIHYESGRVRQHVKIHELPHTVIDFMMFRTPQKTANDDVVEYVR